MRIAQFLPQGGGWGPIDASAPTRGLGGRETAVVKLALEWARLGCEVTTFCPVDSTSVVKMRDGRAEFVTKDLGIVSMASMGWDAVVLWEEPGAALVKGVRDMTSTLVCSLQVAHVDAAPEMNELLDAWVCLSPWASGFLRALHPYVERDRIEVLPNCVDWSLYERAWDPSRAAPHAPPRFTYASSPDRGLCGLLRAWPAIRERWPGAKLKVAYGVERWLEATLWSHSMQSEQALTVRELLKQDGVDYVGRIGQDAVCMIHTESDCLLYPCDPLSPTETGCITVMEAMAAGNVPVLTDADCLGTEFQGRGAVVEPLPYDQDRYLDAIELALTPERWRQLREEGRAFIEAERRWDVVGAQWLQMLQRVKGSAERRSRAAQRGALAKALG